METIIKGGTLMLFLSNKSIPLATNHTLTINANTSDVSNKDISGGAWGASSVTQFTWEASTDNLYSTAGVSDLYTKMIAGTPVNAFFGVKAEAADAALPGGGSWTPSAEGFVGKVIITSLETTAQNGENATFSATFTGYGSLEYVTDYDPDAAELAPEDPEDPTPADPTPEDPGEAVPEN